MLHALLYAGLSLAYLLHAKPQLLPTPCHCLIAWLPVTIYAILAIVSALECRRVKRRLRTLRNRGH